MRAIILILIMLISGCQNTGKETVQTQKNAKHPVVKTNKQAIYDRYKNKSNRYTKKQDSAPTHPKKMSFKEPVPKTEPLSRYGNPAQYKVEGRKYDVMKSSSGYKTRGVASWYGSKFHNQRTSSGEPYDMYVMSAAHRTLPLPTYLKVKNLDNGKTAVVKVNDRGPFRGDRVLDVSYAAAVKLGIYPKGTAHVEIETLKGPSAKAQYYLQVGAFFSKSSATQLKDKLARLTPSPVFVEYYRLHYVVRVGPFANERMSNNLKTKLAQNGISNSFSVLV